MRVLALGVLFGCVHHAPVATPDVHCDDAVAPIQISGAEHIAHVPDAKVSRVRVTGADPALAASLSAYLQIKPGDPVDRSAIAEDVRRLWKSGVVTDVEVAATANRDGTDVTFEVTPQPLIARVEIGGSARDDIDMRRMRALEGTPYDPQRITRIAQALEDAMHYEGYPDAKVHAHLGAGSVCVQAKRGPYVTIGKLVLDGAHDVKVEAVAKQIRRQGGVNAPGGIYDESMLTEDRHRMQEVYWENGKPDATIGDPTVERHGDHLDVKIPVKEGATYHLGVIDSDAFDGFAMPFGIRTGDLFQRSRVTAAVSRLQSRVASADNVHVETQVDTTRHTIAIHLLVDWNHLWDAFLLLPRR